METVFIVLISFTFGVLFTMIITKFFREKNVKKQEKPDEKQIPEKLITSNIITIKEKYCRSNWYFIIDSNNEPHWISSDKVDIFAKLEIGKMYCINEYYNTEEPRYYAWEIQGIMREVTG